MYRTHERALPPPDAERLDRAVDAELTATLGSDAAQKVYARVARQEALEGVRPSQRALAWMSASMPRAADRVLAVARDHYEGAGA